MAIIDLTLPIPEKEHTSETGTAPWKERHTVRRVLWRIGAGNRAYDARVYFFRLWSMSGTYIDFPGHIDRTDNGETAANCTADKLYRLPATVIHLDRADGSGKIKCAELQAACPVEGVKGKALVVNALGNRRFDAVEWRSVYLAREAVDWIAGTGIHVLVSDVYESDSDPQNVFVTLFAAGVSTVCCPVNLHRLGKPHGLLTVLPLRLAEASQAPCRVVAEW